MGDVELMDLRRRRELIDPEGDPTQKLRSQLFLILDDFDVTMEHHLRIPRSGGVTSLDRTEIVRNTVMVMA